MRNITAKGLITITALVTLSACSSLAPDVQVKTFKQDKKRLDQIVEGTVGNWQYAPQAVSNQIKDTRKVYFVEFSKEPTSPPNIDYLIATEDTMQDNSQATDISSRRDVNNFVTSDRQQSSRPTTVGLRQPRLDIPKFEDEEINVEESFETQLSYKDYKVQKNDTLQKISKKFYNSYSKWRQIYDANKDVISNPDALQPGMSLRIPIQ